MIILGKIKGVFWIDIGTELRRPATADSAKTSNIDSDEEESN